MINLDNHQIVSKNEWIAARKVLLKKEKEFTALRDVTNLVNKDEICLGLQLIKNISLKDQMEKKLCQIFLMEEVS